MGLFTVILINDHLIVMLCVFVESMLQSHDDSSAGEEEGMFK